MKKTLSILLLHVAWASVFARGTIIYSEAYLQKSSQLIVIVRLEKVRDIDEHNSALWPGQSKLLGVEATFSVLKVIKGDLTSHAIILHYYRWDNYYKTSDPESAQGSDANSPELIYFKPSSTSQFILYLMKDGASRYAPASGQLDSAYQSVILIPPKFEVPIVTYRADLKSAK